MKIDDSTIFVGVYGTLHRHPWIDPAHLEDDAYSLFNARATSMGWSTSDAHGVGPVLWGMNDAGQDLSSTATRVAWFQVGVADPHHDRPLPVQPVLACADDTLARLGTLHLAAVSVLLPLAGSASSVAHLVAGLNWYSTSNPAARTTLHVTVEPGEVDVIRPVAAQLVAAVRRIDTGPFTVDAVLPGSQSVVLGPGVGDDLWLGTGRHPVTFACSAPEWSLDAIGWLAGLVAAVCTTLNVRTSVLLSATRAGSDR